MTIKSRWARTAIALCAASVVGAAVLALPGLATSASDPLVVGLATGQVRGVDTGVARTFSGIRYAEPPVGDLRWTPPKPAKPWSGIADATKPGKECAQTPVEGAPPATTGEDCLFLNVTTPRRPSAEPLPVVVWFHGGGYTTGAGSQYDAQRMATEGNVVVVTINYRLGVFGYFGHPDLPGSGNFGLADQLAALEWTERNAAAFGGDNANVTLYGQSAGAMSACAMLTSPAAEGLVDKAILSSGSCLLDWPTGSMFPSAPASTPYSALATTESDGAAAAEKMGCGKDSDPVGCMRRKPVDDLLRDDVNQSFANHLTYDTPLLPNNPADALREGQFLRVPVISGGNHDEMRPFIAGAAMQQPITAERYPELLRNTFGDNADAVAARYPLSDYQSPALAWATVTTDSTWSCDTLAGDRLLAEHTPVYAYEFADKNAPNVNGIESPDMPMGAAHATELPSLFDLYGQDLLTPEQRPLAAQMIDYWTTFAHTGDPNSANSPRWRQFDEDAPVLSLAPEPDGIRPADYAADHKCGFWQDIK